MYRITQTRMYKINKFSVGVGPGWRGMTRLKNWALALGCSWFWGWDGLASWENFPKLHVRIYKIMNSLIIKISKYEVSSFSVATCTSYNLLNLLYRMKKTTKLKLDLWGISIWNMSGCTKNFPRMQKNFLKIGPQPMCVVDWGPISPGSWGQICLLIW